MKKPTNDQIAEEIQDLTALKNVVPPETKFGDNNHAGIDVQILVLSTGMTHDQIYDRWGQEDSEDCYDEHKLDLALQASMWMRGESSEIPSTGWADNYSK